MGLLLKEGLRAENFGKLGVGSLRCGAQRHGMPQPMNGSSARFSTIATPLKWCLEKGMSGGGGFLHLRFSGDAQPGLRAGVR